MRTKEKVTTTILLWTTKCIKICLNFLPHVFLIIFERTVKEEVLFIASMGTIKILKMHCIRLRNNQTMLNNAFVSCLPVFLIFVGAPSSRSRSVAGSTERPVSWGSLATPSTSHTTCIMNMVISLLTEFLFCIHWWESSIGRVRSSPFNLLYPVVRVKDMMGATNLITLSPECLVFDWSLSSTHLVSWLYPVLRAKYIWWVPLISTPCLLAVPNAESLVYDGSH